MLDAPNPPGTTVASSATGLTPQASDPVEPAFLTKAEVGRLPLDPLILEAETNCRNDTVPCLGWCLHKMYFLPVPSQNGTFGPPKSCLPVLDGYFINVEITGLEREEGELVRNSIIVLDPPARIKQSEEEVAQLREEIHRREEIEQDLQEDLRTAQEQIELLNTVGAMDAVDWQNSRSHRKREGIHLQPNLQSSLTSLLLRCILTKGSVYYDGKLTSSINLDVLRSNVTIIPQTVRQLTFFTQPELLSGSLQENLDLFSQYDDATLNRAPRALGLLSLQSDEESRLTLDSQIASSGSNLTVGQQQILALARALVHGSKLLILDEATSAIGNCIPLFLSTDCKYKAPYETMLTPDPDPPFVAKLPLTFRYLGTSSPPPDRFFAAKDGMQDIDITWAFSRTPPGSADSDAGISTHHRISRGTLNLTRVAPTPARVPEPVLPVLSPYPLDESSGSNIDEKAKGMREGETHVGGFVNLIDKSGDRDLLSCCNGREYIGTSINSQQRDSDQDMGVVHTVLVG
ncbi:hypothetical protein BJY52DRAFT_1371751 [Lactarius psammicola]|nr:hypothetical protein BJY52DRAFT_1371751 [Lactarius psammicola]